MIMMFGDQATMIETKSTDWINSMLHFMDTLDRELRESGEWVGGHGLADPTQAKTVRLENGVPVATDGPFAEAKDLIAGWMVIDVDNYERAIELAGELSAAPGAGGEPIHEWLEVRPFLAALPIVTEGR
jgi:hypothetical protein